MSGERTNRLVDLPHFNRDRQLSSCLNIDIADDGGLFVSLIGTARDIKGENQRITTKLDGKEGAYVAVKLLGYLLGE